MNYYAKAIDILASNAPEKILRQIAKANPAAVCKAHDALNPPPAWEDEARALCAAGAKIKAIKLCREKTGLGLKEAKYMVEDNFY